MKLQNIDLQTDDIRQFCHKWQMIEFALFGSVLRDDFSPDSDIDSNMNRKISNKIKGGTNVHPNQPKNYFKTN